MSSPIRDVSDTAFWIAYHRKLESERSDALFHDPFAAKLAGERGKRISEAMPTSRVVAWTVALRTRRTSGISPRKRSAWDALFRRPADCVC
jgi:O-methyltransferase involved in polyketide biosynthesis